MSEKRGAVHPLYVSVAEINYNNSDGFASVLCKIFSDDLKLALQKQFHDVENLDDTKNDKKFSSKMVDYIKNHLQLKVNGKVVSLVFADFKKDDNAYLVNFRINNINAVQRFEIEDNIFYELYDKQIQVVYVTVNGNRKSGRVINPESKLAFDF
jgi:hypothetical protein